MKGVVLFGHGSRDPAWKLPMEKVATRVAKSSPDTRVVCAYLELDQPDLGSAVAGLVNGGAVEIAILPMFLGVGRHAREDLPRLVDAARQAHPRVSFRVLPAIGEDDEVLDLIARRALV
ncbi:sirohydrochlorin chelatase [Ramlibacter sp.]|uniref:sirohydrochlorin chelatase n=1 Tax=Ramlibacter sp. TaxID=1917967 RepID=UPI003D108485